MEVDICGNNRFLHRENVGFCQYPGKSNPKIPGELYHKCFEGHQRQGVIVQHSLLSTGRERGEMSYSSFCKLKQYMINVLN